MVIVILALTYSQYAFAGFTILGCELDSLTEPDGDADVCRWATSSG